MVLILVMTLALAFVMAFTLIFILARVLAHPDCGRAGSPHLTRQRGGGCGGRTLGGNISKVSR